MIDSVALNMVIAIPIADLKPSKWRECKKENGETVFIHIKNHVKIKYFPLSHKLRITGKILRLVENSNIKNLDDVYGMDLESFTRDINNYLNMLFYETRVDVRDFEVTRIDYCFNVWTPYVESYISFLGRAFRAVNNGSRKNFTEEHDLNGSVYIKTSSEYKNNSKKNYALNFYNKEDWLNKKRKEGMVFSSADQMFARDIFRLEVQVYSVLARTIATRLEMEKTFGNFLCYDVAEYVMGSAYKKIFYGDENCDFYKYSFAKQAQLTDRGKELLELAAEHHRINDKGNSYQLSKIKNLGIYPYCFLPKDFDLDVLGNPLRLIRDKINELDNGG